MRLPWRKEDWEILEFQRQDRDPPPPAGYMTWTYKRKKGQRLIWAIFGNDEEGVTPWSMGKAWTWWKWWRRNPMTNLRWYVIGQSNWDEGLVPNSSRDRSHLEYKFWIGNALKYQDYDWTFSWTRKIGHRVWFPFVCIKLGWGVRFWIGWKPYKGELDCSLKKR